VTRGAGQAAKLSDALSTLGVIPIEVPVLEIQPPQSFDALDVALGVAESYDWLVLTSANAVRAVAQRAKLLSVELDSVKVAAVGPATAKEAESHGLHVALVPDAYVAESLVAALAEKTRGKRVLLAACGRRGDRRRRCVSQWGSCGSAGPAAQGVERAFGCRDVHQLFERYALEGCGGTGGDCVSVSGRAGNFDWADYERYTARDWLGTCGRGCAARYSWVGSGSRTRADALALPGLVFGVTEGLEVAAVALGLAGVADLAAVMDDLVREADPAVVRQDLHQLLLDLLRSVAFGEREAARDAEDMSVHDDALGFAEADT